MGFARRSIRPLIQHSTFLLLSRANQLRELLQIDVPPRDHRHDRAPGAAVSGSAPRIFTCGASWRMELPMPETSPPPPIAAMTVRTDGRSSRISNPSDALPAMKL